MAEDPDGLSWLIYTSFAAETFDEGRLTALLAQSRADNDLRGVTGLLLFKDQRFLQALEGRADVIRPLMSRIEDDLRHIDVYVLLEEPVTARRFPFWAMGYQGWSPGEDAWPTELIDTFRAVTGEPASDDTMPAIRELFDWFRDPSSVSELAS